MDEFYYMNYWHPQYGYQDLNNEYQNEIRQKELTDEYSAEVDNVKRAEISKKIIDVMTKYKIEYAETNLNLEDNIKIQQTWKNFEHDQHKRRRCFIKTLDAEK